jgi:diacylglycerol O-acyltransferase / wax synthase
MGEPAVDQAPGPEPAPAPDGDRPLGAADAFFVYAESRRVPQTIVAAMVCDAGMTRTGLAELVASRLDQLPWMRRRLRRRWFGLRRPIWQTQAEIDLAWHVTEAPVPVPGGMAGFAALAARQSGRRLPRNRPPWRMWAVPDLGRGQAGWMIAVHHAVCDGPALVELVGPLFDRPVHASGGRAAPAAPPGWRDRLASAARTGRGVALLASDGMVRAGPFTRRVGAGRVVATAPVPLATVRAASRAAAGAQPTDVVLAALGGAVRQLLPGAVEEGRPLRAAVPVLARSGADATEAGNRTAALWVRVPLAEADPVRRLAAVAADRRQAVASPRAAGTRFVLERVGAVLPAPIQALAVRGSYRGRFFHTIVSVMPGPRRVVGMGEAKILAAYPILPLAERVGLALGGLVWNDALCLGLACAEGVVGDPRAFLTAVVAEIDRLAVIAAPTVQSEVDGGVPPAAGEREPA